MLTPRQTRQALLAHLEACHASQNVGHGRWNRRSTLEALQHSHGYAHHHYGDRTHGHHAEGEPPNTGPDHRPAGWRTGLDVVPAPERPRSLLGRTRKETP